MPSPSAARFRPLSRADLPSSSPCQFEPPTGTPTAGRSCTHTSRRYLRLDRIGPRGQVTAGRIIARWPIMTSPMSVRTPHDDGDPQFRPALRLTSGVPVAMALPGNSNRRGLRRIPPRQVWSPSRPDREATSTEHGAGPIAVVTPLSRCCGRSGAGRSRHRRRRSGLARVEPSGALPATKDDSRTSPP